MTEIEKELEGNLNNSTLDGSLIFKIRDTHGMPLCYMFDYIINQKKLMVDWLGFMIAAKLAGWKWKKTFGDIEYGLRDANIDKDVITVILDRIKPWERIYNEPEIKLKRGWQQAKNGDILYDLHTIEFVITRDKNLHEFKDEVRFYPKDGKLFCKKCNTDLKLKEDHIITVCDCYKHEAYEKI